MYASVQRCKLEVSFFLVALVTSSGLSLPPNPSGSWTVALDFYDEIDDEYSLDHDGPLPTATMIRLVLVDCDCASTGRTWRIKFSKSTIL